MNERIRAILTQIAELEDELRTAIHEQEERLLYRIHGKRVEFEQAIRQAHAKLKVGIFRWILTIRPRNLLTLPIIYAMIVPLVILDLCVSFYHATCFPIYGIPKVKRGDYLVFDHQYLAYLNAIEKLQCLYCSYAIGLIAYAREITARTEQYFCPIKHARRVRGRDARYAQFLDYGDAEGLPERLEAYRDLLHKEK